MFTVILKRFTLIELLVVVAIIAILAALLLPVLGRAKVLAIRTACLSQMHQQGIGFTTYADENDGSFKLYYSDNSPSIWTTFTGPTPKVVDLRPTLLAMTGDNTMWFCPSKGRQADSTSFRLISNYYYCDYLILAGLGSVNVSQYMQVPATTKPKVLPRRITDDPTMALSADMAFSRPAQPNGGTATWPTGAIHKAGGAFSGTNVLYLDGHAEWRSRHEASAQMYRKAAASAWNAYYFW